MLRLQFTRYTRAETLPFIHLFCLIVHTDGGGLYDLQIPCRFIKI
jgi:hypothetical protein